MNAAPRIGRLRALFFLFLHRGALRLRRWAMRTLPEGHPMRDFEELALERLDGLAQKAIEAGAMPDDRGYAFFVVVLLAIFGTAIGLDVLFIDE